MATPCSGPVPALLTGLRAARLILPLSGAALTHASCKVSATVRTGSGPPLAPTLSTSPAAEASPGPPAGRAGPPSAAGEDPLLLVRRLLDVAETEYGETRAAVEAAPPGDTLAARAARSEADELDLTLRVAATAVVNLRVRRAAAPLARGMADAFKASVEHYERAGAAQRATLRTGGNRAGGNWPTGNTARP